MALSVQPSHAQTSSSGGVYTTETAPTGPGGLAVGYFWLKPSTGEVRILTSLSPVTWTLVGAGGAPGPVGPQGDVGPQGPVGPQGVIGLTGPAGADGAQGVQGIPGPPVTPVYTLLANGTTAMAFGTNTAVKVTPTATATFTTTVPAAGSVRHLVILTSGVTSRTITFGTGFKPVGTLATGTVTARVFVVTFISDGVNLYEAGRTVAMVA